MMAGRLVLAIVCGMLGLMFGGPIGALIGAAVGWHAVG